MMARESESDETELLAVPLGSRPLRLFLRVKSTSI